MCFAPPHTCGGGGRLFYAAIEVFFLLTKSPFPFKSAFWLQSSCLTFLALLRPFLCQSTRRTQWYLCRWSHRFCTGRAVGASCLEIRFLMCSFFGCCSPGCFLLFAQSPTPFTSPFPLLDTLRTTPAGGFFPPVAPPRFERSHFPLLFFFPRFPRLDSLIRYQPQFFFSAHVCCMGPFPWLRLVLRGDF